MSRYQGQVIRSLILFDILIHNVARINIYYLLLW